MKVRHWAMLVMTALLVTIVGCSRQGAVTSSTIGSKPSRNSPQIGDMAEYSLECSTALFGGSSATQTTGRKTLRVTVSANRRRVVPSHIVRSFDIQEDQVQYTGGLRKSVNVIVWLGEDTSGNLYLLGESPDGQEWDFVTDATLPLYMPAEIKSGSAWQYTANFGSGNTESVVYRCISTEKLRTPAGEFDAYKLGTTISHTRFVPLAGYKWISPDLPYVFELRTELSSSDPVHGIPQKIDLVTTLESINRAQ